MTLTPLSKARTVGYLLLQLPTDITAGWAASPVDTMPPDPHYTAGYILAQGNNSNLT